VVVLKDRTVIVQNSLRRRKSNSLI
jgi:hypothetical protein